jgi:hypothetical protein
MVPLSKLVEDDSLYPRVKVDGINVRDIEHGIRSGATLPPIVVDERMRIIDGYHRRRAWLRVLGDGGEVAVDVRSYPDEGAAYMDAVRLNAGHGKRLSSIEQTRAALRLRELGLGDREIGLVVRVPERRVIDLTARVAISSAAAPVPLKGGDVHLSGRVLSDEAVEALGRRTVSSYGHMARQLLDGVREGLLPDDPGLAVVLSELRITLGDAGY